MSNPEDDMRSFREDMAYLGLIAVDEPMPWTWELEYWHRQYWLRVRIMWLFENATGELSEWLIREAMKDSDPYRWFQNTKFGSGPGAVARALYGLCRTGQLCRRTVMLPLTDAQSGEKKEHETEMYRLGSAAASPADSGQVAPEGPSTGENRAK